MPPVATDDHYTTPFNTSLTVAATGILTNDTDANVGQTLTVVNVTQPQNGTVAVGADGSFTYTPSPGFVGVDTYTYRVFDGASYSNVATVYITVLPGSDVHLCFVRFVVWVVPRMHGRGATV